MARRLCVVSRNPLMSGVFVAGLTTLVGSRDELEIIVDRRRGGPTTDQPSIERRHRPHVVRALERDGFALMLKPTTPTGERASLNLPQGPGVSPIERLALEETYEHKLERVLWFKHGRIVRLSRWLILSGLMNAILVLLLLSPAVKTLISRARPPASPSSIVAPVPEVAEPPSSKPVAPVAETTSPNPEVRPRPQSGRRESPEARR